MVMGAFSERKADSGQKVSLRGWRAGLGLLTVVILVASLAAAFSPGSGAPAVSALAPATKADAGSGSGTGPTSDPAANIAPSPNFLSDCSGTAFDNSSGCTNATLAAIDNARNQEGLPGMVLPTDWAQLTPAQQLFVS